jgi:hypothetical protein
VAHCRARFAFFGLTALVVVGCAAEDSDSCKHETDEMSVVALAIDNGVDMRVEVDFDASDRTEFAAPISLCEDDDLSIAGEVPERTDRIDRVVYSVNLDAADAAREIDVVLDRKSHDSADFTIIVPPAFDVLAPQIDDMVPRATDFILEWAPPGDGTQIRIGLLEEIGAGLCLETTTVDHEYKSIAGVSVDDSGTWTIPAGVIANADGGECEAVYTFKRLGPAPYPEAYRSGGFVEGRTERTVAFRSIP